MVGEDGQVVFLLLKISINYFLQINLLQLFQITSISLTNHLKKVWKCVIVVLIGNMVIEIINLLGVSLILLMKTTYMLISGAKS
jgi:hypothetical protein